MNARVAFNAGCGLPLRRRQVDKVKERRKHARPCLQSDCVKRSCQSQRDAAVQWLELKHNLKQLDFIVCRSILLAVNRPHI
eukprot:7378832-Prymnesium_polylepis.1